MDRLRCLGDGQLLEAVKLLSNEQFLHEFADSSSSVRHQFTHLLLVADRYRARLAHEQVPDISFEEFITVQDLMGYEAQLRQRVDNWIEKLPADNLNRVQEHATRRGFYRATVEQTLYHIVNHATYHHGQVACLLKKHDVQFADTDFIIWLNRNKTRI